MNLRVECDERTLAVEVAGRQVKINDREMQCDCRRLPNGHYSLIVDGRVYDFIIEFSDGRCSLTGRHGSLTLGVADARRLDSARSITAAATGLQRITAEMPGKVIRVLVGAGDPVAFDQGLLVVEAMKMQNEIRAPKPGTVREIGVSAGGTVSTGDFLISIE